jgi:hypothetical protein
MIDPAKLLASAARLWGDQMDAVWGAFLPVPSGQVIVLTGGERLELAGTGLKVAYTPGHAKHHVSFLDEHTGIAYVGDTAGVRVSGDYLIAPTPPPDIDIEAWQHSLDTIDAWQPVSLFVTHFGPISPARAHLARFRITVASAAETRAQMIAAAEPTTSWRSASSSGCVRMSGRPCPNTKRARRSSPRRLISYGKGWRGIGKKKQTTKRITSAIPSYFSYTATASSRRARRQGRRTCGSTRNLSA